MLTNSYQDLRGGGLKHIASPLVLKQYMPYANQERNNVSVLHRKSKSAPADNGTFIKPLKQSLMKNARLMPGTRVMLALLAGWDGRSQTIKTTMGSIGKHLGRSARQVFRYLKDASEEGYLVYSRTKDRMGYITGIRIWLNFGAIKHCYDVQKPQKQTEYRINEAMTHTSDINSNSYLKGIKDDRISDVLAGIAETLGVEYDPNPQE